MQGQFIFVYREAVKWVNGVPVALTPIAGDGAAFELHEARVIDESGRIMGEGRDPTIPALRAFMIIGARSRRWW